MAMRSQRRSDAVACNAHPEPRAAAARRCRWIHHSQRPCARLRAQQDVRAAGVLRRGGGHDKTDTPGGASLIELSAILRTRCGAPAGRLGWAD